MMRQFSKLLALSLLLGGILLRALTPVGYMPGTLGDSTLFALCPEQLPPGISLPDDQATLHHHRHHGSGDESSTDSDLCQIGHLLFSAVAADTSDFSSILIPAADEYLTVSFESTGYTPVFYYRSRAPPA